VSVQRFSRARRATGFFISDANSTLTAPRRRPANAAIPNEAQARRGGCGSAWPPLAARWILHARASCWCKSEYFSCFKVSSVLPAKKVRTPSCVDRELVVAAAFITPIYGSDAVTRSLAAAPRRRAIRRLRPESRAD